jgi:multidrug transporter EmrE-like cation transporter
MTASKLIAIALIVAGVLGLLYGGFSFNKASHELKIGPLELSVTEKETVNVPLWASIGAIVAGVGLLAFGGKK